MLNIRRFSILFHSLAFSYPKMSSGKSRESVACGPALLEVAWIIFDIIQSRDQHYGAAPKPDCLEVDHSLFGTEIIVPLTSVSLEKKQEQYMRQQLQHGNAGLLMPSSVSRSFAHNASSRDRLNDF
jgi:hypothetical protein